MTDAWFSRGARTLLALALVSCGGDAPPGAEGTSGGESADEWDDFDASFDDDLDDDFDGEPQVVSHLVPLEELDISGPDQPWYEMSHQDQEWYMIGKVLPVMKVLFADFDVERWDPAAYGCATCHGEDGRERGYEMPGSNQIPIPRPGTAKWRAMQREYGPEIVSFMQRDVTETMATLLGEDGGCWFCHPRAR
ncbi:MAG: hypothetical protein AAGH15_17735 [Myxococcota bacterium]